MLVVYVHDAERSQCLSFIHNVIHRSIWYCVFTLILSFFLSVLEYTQTRGTWTETGSLKWAPLCKRHVSLFTFRLYWSAQFCFTNTALCLSLEQREHFSQFRDTTDVLSCHICLPVCLWIIGPSQQSCEQECYPWKWGAAANYRASHTQTMLPARKSVPRSSRHLDHMKTSWPSSGDANSSGMDMFPVHQVWPKPPWKAQWKREEDKADRRRDEKTTSGNRQTRSLQSTRGQRRTEENGGNWLWSHLQWPNDPRG